MQAKNWVRSWRQGYTHHTYMYIFTCTLTDTHTHTHTHTQEYHKKSTNVTVRNYYDFNQCKLTKYMPHLNNYLFCYHFQLSSDWGTAHQWSCRGAACSSSVQEGRRRGGLVITGAEGSIGSQLTQVIPQLLSLAVIRGWPGQESAKFSIWIGL